jgi:nucleoside-diphosphate-sugar epimerase
MPWPDSNDKGTSMHVFLTGGTGFIGQALVCALRRRDWTIAALVRDPESAPARWLSTQGCRLVRGDVTRVGGLRQAMLDADVVLHSAGVYELGASARERDRMRQVNVQGTDHVLGAALNAGVPRTVYVSTVWALGDSGSGTADESQLHCGRYLTDYERSKCDAHQVALSWRARGLPLVIVMPNAVMGANDHSLFGYFLRLYLMGRLPPMAWGRDMTYSMVDVQALAEGIALAAEKAPIGEDYVFCGPPQSIGTMFEHWGRHPGGMRPRWWLPHWFMRAQFMFVAPALRALRLPAFMSPDAVDASRVNLNYSSAKAHRDLDWRHPDAAAMWDRIVQEERALIEARRGFLQRLRHRAVLS